MNQFEAVSGSNVWSLQVVIDKAGRWALKGVQGWNYSAGT